MDKQGSYACYKSKNELCEWKCKRFISAASADNFLKENQYYANPKYNTTLVPAGYNLPLAIEKYYLERMLTRKARVEIESFGQI